MLRYLGSGLRRFGLYPIPPHPRGNWEFLAVVAGSCAAVLSNDGVPNFCQRHLWVFPPDVAHGWAGVGSQRCRVVVFHFGTVPPLLEKLARTHGHLGRSLTPNEARRLTTIHDEARPYFDVVTEKSELMFEQVLMELSLMALAHLPTTRNETSDDYARRKVEEVLAWYSEHVAEQPKLEHIAQAANVSVRHLRRLFWQVRQESPQRAFTRARLDHVISLLSNSTLKLDAIATKCGFSSSADLCRVFKAHHMLSPDVWRRTKPGPYAEPSAKG
jgi:AraC-like DNA-binding protein